MPRPVARGNNSEVAEVAGHPIRRRQVKLPWPTVLRSRRAYTPRYSPAWRRGGNDFKMVAAWLRSEHGLRVCGEAVRKIIRRL